MSNRLVPVQYARKLMAWVTNLLDAGFIEWLARLWSVLSRKRPVQSPPGPYEVLEYESRLDLQDTRGRKAVFYKRQRVRFLQDNIIAYQDQTWGDGEIFADYKCSPGVAVDRYRDGHRYRVLISLRETKNRGDVEEFHTERTIRGGFVKDVESFQTEINHVTHKLSVSVVFPRSRSPKRVTLTEQNAERTVPLGPNHQLALPDGRQQVIWRANMPRLYEAYILRWEW
jgi:hypothetical protein